VHFLHTGSAGFSQYYLHNQQPVTGKEAMVALGEPETLEALPGRMAPLEPLQLASPRAALLPWLPQLLLTHYAAQHGEWALLEGPEDALVERMLALLGALARLLVLAPHAALPLLSWQGDATPASLSLLQAQEFLERTAGSHRSAERTPAWAWAAVDPGRATPAEAAASALAGAHRSGEVTAKEAKGIPVRRHLLACLAGPVTSLSATAEAHARLLAAPSLALQALIIRGRLERALGAVGGWLYDSEVVAELRAEVGAQLAQSAAAAAAATATAQPSTAGGSGKKRKA
jgi:hypothetical protein